jgi:hypothetical protein
VVRKVAGQSLCIPENIGIAPNTALQKQMLLRPQLNSGYILFMTVYFPAAAD